MPHPLLPKCLPFSLFCTSTASHEKFKLSYVFSVVSQSVLEAILCHRNWDYSHPPKSQSYVIPLTDDWEHPF